MANNLRPRSGDTLVNNLRLRSGDTLVNNPRLGGNNHSNQMIAKDTRIGETKGNAMNVKYGAKPHNRAETNTSSKDER
jgi:hypothetical protein